MLGPLDVLVLTFPTTELSIGVRLVLEGVRRDWDVQLVDAVLLSKPDRHSVYSFELADLDGLTDIAVELATRRLVGITDRADLDEIGGCLEPGSTALVLVVEHLWVSGVIGRAERSGGRCLGRVSVPAGRGAGAAVALRSEARMTAAGT